MLLGVDTGGTFTDFVLLNPDQTIRIHKVLSTPEAPEQAILQGVDELGLMTAARAGLLTIIHGSTVATNAALEGKGVSTAFITNRGFKDMLTIGRQTRRELYNLQPAALAPPVPHQLCLETGGRIAADGSLIEPLTNDDIEQLIEQLRVLKPEAVAINLLFSFLDNKAEKRLEQAISEAFDQQLFISRSSFVLPEYKEYERGMATWLNSWLGPLVERYLQNLQQQLKPTPIAVMQSSGGTIDASQASQRAVNMLLSGPAGGLSAAHYIGNSTNSKRLLTFDMGGTSTDVALIDHGIQLTNEGRIGNYPVAVPMVDMHTIGAGGGSIAWIDQGGLLQLGPKSAGAAPGPACYGKGGLQPTVTDANAVLGRLRPDAFLGGTMQLDIEAASRAIETIAKPLGLSVIEAADGILQIANEHMTRALRVISVQQGHDPHDFQLCCFGGAGGLHVCELAEQLGMHRALIPIHGGVLSALGMLVAPRQRQLSRTHQRLLNNQASHSTTAGIDNSVDDEINAVLKTLVLEGQAQLLAENLAADSITVQPSIDLRYQGQSYTLNIAWSNSEHAIDAFHQAHKKRYGHKMDLPIELVNVRAALNAQTTPFNLPRQHSSPNNSVNEQTNDRQDNHEVTLQGFNKAVKIYPRESLISGVVIVGPCLITEQVSTTLIAEGWVGELDKFGHLILEKSTHSN